MPSYEHDVRAILKEHGCYFIRNGKGDHEIWKSPISGRHFTVDSKIKSRHKRSLEAGRCWKAVLASPVPFQFCDIRSLALVLVA